MINQDLIDYTARLLKIKETCILENKPSSCLSCLSNDKTEANTKYEPTKVVTPQLPDVQMLKLDETKPDTNADVHHSAASREGRRTPKSTPPATSPILC